jgi:hypothetical protein
MNESKSRGSDKLGALSPDALQKALGLARESYKIERWWKYGQPKIDRIGATLNVTNIGEAGKVFSGLISQHGNAAQIRFKGFPYGTPILDGVRIEVQIDQAVGGG